ncbi:MAG: hypothetical protein HQL08_09020 [Nitrospirae bacterium]|nr:hypothetical protein [Nitrospirota bacterium]
MEFNFNKMLTLQNIFLLIGGAFLVQSPVTLWAIVNLLMPQSPGLHISFFTFILGSLVSALLVTLGVIAILTGTSEGFAPTNSLEGEEEQPEPETITNYQRANTPLKVAGISEAREKTKAA